MPGLAAIVATAAGVFGGKPHAETPGRVILIIVPSLFVALGGAGVGAAATAYFADRDLEKTVKVFCTGTDLSQCVSANMTERREALANAYTLLSCPKEENLSDCVKQSATRISDLSQDRNTLAEAARCPTEPSKLDECVRTLRQSRLPPPASETQILGGSKK